MTPLRGARAITVVEWVVPLVPPVLFAVFPLFVLFAHNQTEVERAELWRPLAICVISAMALYGLFAIVFGNGPKAGALASLVVVAFCFYGSDARQVSGWGLGGGWFDALWLALLVLGVVALVRTTRDPYIFGEHGQAVAFPNRSDEALGSRRGMRFYLRQLKFVNAKLIDVVDAIRARSKRPPDRHPVGRGLPGEPRRLRRSRDAGHTDQGSDGPLPSGRG